MNVVTLIGILATDVDLSEATDRKRRARFLLAIDRAAGDQADLVWVTAWDEQAEACHAHLSKGRKVALDGRLRSRSWQEGGKQRSAVEVVARRVQFLGPAPDVRREAAAASEAQASRGRR